MADLAASDVTVTLIKRGRIPGFANLARVTMAFGNTSKTVPSAGIPLPADLKMFGVRGEIFGMVVEGAPTDGLVYHYDSAGHKLVIRQSPGFTPPGTIVIDSHVHDLRVIGGITADEDLGVLASGPTLGKLAASNRVIAGADQATKGGVVPVVATATVSGSSVAAGPLAAYTGAIAPTTVKALVFGD